MKKYLIIDSKTSLHEYTLIHEVSDKNEELFKLYYSEGGQWSEGTKGKLALTLIDDGNDVRFDKLPKSNIFDYSLINEVRLLLNFKSNTEPNFHPEYKVIEDKILMEI